jgi:RNase P/RNase MRP subunit POP5
MQEKMSQLFGDCGLGLFGSVTHVKFFDSERLIFIIRAPRDSFNEVHFALTSICEMKKKSMVARVLSVCSCNRTCREKIKQLYFTYIELDSGLSQTQKDQHHATTLNRISSVDL